MSETPKYIEHNNDFEGSKEFKINEKLIEEKGISDDIAEAIGKQINKLNSNLNTTDEQLANINKIIDNAIKIFEDYIVGEADLKKYEDAISQILNGKKLQLKPLNKTILSQLPSGRKLSASEKTLANLTERNREIKEKGTLKYAFGKIFN